MSRPPDPDAPRAGAPVEPPAPVPPGADAAPVPSEPDAPPGPPLVDLVLLGVAVAAVSTAAPLIRGASAPSLAIAFWRNVLVLPVIGAAVWWRSRDELRSLSRPLRRLSVVSGLLLAAHFATWVPSVSLTSVASSVALVATQPVWAAVIARARGQVVARGTWWGIGVALAGVVVLSGIDLSISVRALAGDLLALVGGMLAAAYVTVGADVRRTVSTGVYTLVCYSAASVVLVVVCLAARQPLGGYTGWTWLALVAMAAGPQLLGHTVVNRVLRTINPVAVSVAILFEIVGAAALAWIAFGEVPPASAIPAALLIAAGVVVVIATTTGEAAVRAAPAVD